MDVSRIFNQVLVLFFIMIVGYIARKKGIIEKSLNKGITELILNITLPFMIVSSFNYEFSKEMLLNAAKLYVISFVLHLSLALISKYIFYKYDENEKSVLRFALIFSNCGFMGYPVVESVFGKIGIFYTAIFNINFNIFIWTIGVMLFNSKGEKQSIKKAFLNPGLISVIIGLILFIFSIKLPLALQKTLEMVGSTTTPLSMIIIGSMLAEVEFKKLFNDKKLYYVTFLRLIAIPLITLAILKFLNYSSILLGIPVLIMAMPAAANTALFAEKYQADTNLASRCVFLTTILSTLTIPLVMLLLN
ncbi:MAG: AEC family transporter [Caloramator sp.]|nr:AEC family transporter [Caloramator sp.]